MNKTAPRLAEPGESTCTNCMFAHRLDPNKTVASQLDTYPLSCLLLKYATRDDHTCDQFTQRNEAACQKEANPN